jgi:hypothetical protein
MDGNFFQYVGFIHSKHIRGISNDFNQEEFSPVFTGELVHADALCERNSCRR